MQIKSIRLWNQFWLREGSPIGLAIFRGLVGLYLLIRYSSWFLNIEQHFSSQGYIFPYYNEHFFDSFGLSFITGWIYAPSVLQAWLIWLVAVISALLMTLGLKTRSACMLSLFCFVYYYNLSLHLSNATNDRVLFFFLFCLIFSPAGRAFSLDSIVQRKRGEPFAAIQQLWTQQLICFQVVMTYFGSGVAKLRFDTWRSGKALTENLQSIWGSEFGYRSVSLEIPVQLFDLAVLGVIIFELWAPLLVLTFWGRVIFVSTGLIFHLINVLLFNLWIFLLVPLAYPLFFLPGRSVEKSNSKAG